MSANVAAETSATANPRDVRNGMDTKATTEIAENAEKIWLCGLGDLCGCLSYCAAYRLFLSSRHPSGGSMTRSDWSKPCAATGSVSTPPPLPMLLPPYSDASLFRSSAYQPGSGTPMRYCARGTGVKLNTITTESA